MGRLLTSRYHYATPKHGLLVRASIGVPKWLTYPMEELLSIAPWGILGTPDREEFRRRYRELLESREALVRADVARLRQVAGARDVILLCFENLNVEGKWCHRRFFAEIWQEWTGEIVHELENLERRGPAGAAAQQLGLGL